MSRRRIAVYLVGLTLLTTLASCKSSEPDPLPTPAKSTTAPSTPPTASWESKYNAKELDAYRAALAQWNAYKAEIQPYNAVGKATPAAKKVYQKYLVPWQFYFKRLQQYEKAGIKIARQGKVLESEATRIKLGKDGASVTIRECVDGTDVGATQHGKPLKNAFDTPQLSEVVVGEVGGRWLITNIPVTAKDRPCNA